MADVIGCLMFLEFYLDHGWARCLNSARPPCVRVGLDDPSLGDPLLDDPSWAV